MQLSAKQRGTAFGEMPIFRVGAIAARGRKAKRAVARRGDDALDVSMSGASPVTVTDSAMAPTSNVISIAVCLPTSSRTSRTK